MLNSKLVAAALAISLMGGSAMAQSWNCIPQGPGGRMCMDEDGNTVTQRRDASGVTTYDSDGEVYRTQRMGGGHSTTYGSDGSVYNTQRTGGGMATTTDDQGNVWQTQRVGEEVLITGQSGQVYRCRMIGPNVSCQ